MVLNGHGHHGIGFVLMKHNGQSVRQLVFLKSEAEFALLAVSGRGENNKQKRK